jgi:pyruvate/2-oxoglutarate/acetoin dehydrogenase E1 component
MKGWDEVAELSIADAIVAATAEEMRRDDHVFYMGTAPVAKLAAEFGAQRSRQTPIAENVMTGAAVGAALSGYRPIVMLSGFTFTAFDQLVNQAAKAAYMFGNQGSVPAVFRASFGNGTRKAAQHSQTGYAMFAHAGGLMIATPSTPTDAKGLFKAAVRSNNPVLFYEEARLATLTEDVPDDLEPIPFGQARIRREGDDVTIVGLMQTVHAAVEAADLLAEDGVSAEVIDLRTVVPLDVATVRASVRKTGRLIVVDESFPMCSVAAELVTAITEDDETFARLTAPVRRICNKPVPIPYSPVLEDFVLPSVDDIVAVAGGLLRGSVPHPVG